MARNAEKQLGRLNRLWLQKEQAEGRAVPVSGGRPRLAALHTAADVRRWIPSIKRELEHCLEQSQLTHYSERKIEEFQEKIDALKKEYHRYLWKLRRLDPTCKEHPWKPRGYTRKRTADGKVPSWVKAGGRPGDTRLSTPILSDINAEITDPAEDDESSSRTGGHEAAAGTALGSANPQNHDSPLEFSTARSRPKDVWTRALYNAENNTTNKRKDILSNQLKGIHAAGQSMVEGKEDQPAAGNSMVGKTEDQPVPGKSGGILGLDCYSSSEEDN